MGKTFKGNLIISNRAMLEKTVIGSKTLFSFINIKVPNETAETKNGVHSHENSDKLDKIPILVKYFISSDRILLTNLLKLVSQP